MKPIRVLVAGLVPAMGGTETIVLNYIRHIDPGLIRFDVLMSGESDEFTRIFEELGITCHRMPRIRDWRKRQRWLRQFFSCNAANYDVLWDNRNLLASLDIQILAKRYGIPVRLVHSHNSQNMSSHLIGILHRIYRELLPNYATGYLTCSTIASRFMFPKRVQKLARLCLNATDLENFVFKPEKRASLRQQLGFGTELIYCQVGRLATQKNQSFLIEVFARLLLKQPTAKLLLLGDGPDKDNLKRQIEEMGLEESVLLMGSRDNIGDWLSVADVFVLPSLFEGMVLVRLEAAVNGLPMVLSRPATSEFFLGIEGDGTVQVLELEESLDIWVQALEKASHQERQSSQERKAVLSQQGWDINQAALTFQNYLIEEVRQHDS